MDLSHRIDRAMSAAIARAQGASVPEGAVPGRLAAALNYAVTPGGARIRPTICLSVAKACGDDRPALADSAAIALELIHCASLVHDDLPAFDNADFRRGKPTVHLAFSEPLAVLTGDSLIIAAFDEFGPRHGPRRAARAETGALAGAPYRHAAWHLRGAGLGKRGKGRSARLSHVENRRAFCCRHPDGRHGCRARPRAMGRTGRPHWRGVPGGR